MSFISGNPRLGVCFEFERTGRCRNGSRCRFRHVRTGGRGTSGGQSGICHQFRDTGYCRFGNSCKYLHVGSGRLGGSGSNPQGRRIQQAQGRATEKFIMHLSALSNNPKKLGPELLKSADLWKKCWQEHKSLNAQTKQKMIEVIAKIPSSSSIEAPPIDQCESLFEALLKQKLTEDKMLDLVRAVLRAIERLLQAEWDPPKELVREGLCNIAVLADGQLVKQKKEHRTVSNGLMNIVDDLEKPWKIKIQKLAGMTNNDEDTDEEPHSNDDWRNANVQWLCNPTFFAPSCCPKMKVGCHGLYDSEDEYLETIIKLWVAMTFVDGHAAFAPHCRSRNQSGIGCNNALWPIASIGTTVPQGLKCRTKRCSNPVEYSCRIKNHDALCAECADCCITDHCKGPGQNASTHIYDCQVGYASQDGVLYLKNFKSRNPPLKAIHWRTTKRLLPPNLVGLVKISVRGCPLLGNDKITWGEVVYHNSHTGDEERHRNKGELAVNISSIIDCDPDMLEEGANVAVIDCMT